MVGNAMIAMSSAELAKLQQRIVFPVLLKGSTRITTRVWMQKFVKATKCMETRLKRLACNAVHPANHVLTRSWTAQVACLAIF